MSMTAKAREFLLKVLGPGRLAALETELPRMERALEDAGIGWKEVSEMDVGALKAICRGPDCQTVGYADIGPARPLAGHSPVQPYIDLLGRRPALATHDEEGEKPSSGDPMATAASPYVRDAIRHGAVRG